MNWRKVTFWLIAGGFLLWVIYDLVIFLTVGGSATISTVFLDLTLEWRGLGYMLCLVIGFILGHILWPQYVEKNG